MVAADIEALLEQADNRLFADLGRTLTQDSAGMASQSDADFEEDGREWLSRNRADVARLVCGSRAVEVYLSSEKAKNRVLIVASVADLIASLIWGAGGVVVAALLVREGLEELCPSEKVTTGA